MALFEDDADIAPTVVEQPGIMQVNIAQAHPRENPYLIGHEAAEAHFLKAWHSDFFHPIQLISGTSGVGKASFAYRIARYVLSGGTVTDSLETDFNSAICRQITGNAHPNLMALEPGLQKVGGKGTETSITRDWLRKLMEHAHKSAAQSGWRVYIIDKVEDISRGSVNSILKILEEPPQRCLFLLISDFPYNLPAPVRSRCQTIHLNPIATEKLHEFLQRSEIEPDPLAMESLAQLSNGCIGQALVWWRCGALSIYDDFIRCLNASFEENPPDDLYALAAQISSQDSKEQKSSEQNLGYSFQIFCTIVGDFLSKAIFAFASGTVPPVIRPHIDEGVIEKLMRSNPDTENWLNLRTLLQQTAKRALPPLRLEKQQTVLEILWRLRYACQANWQAALRKSD